MSNFDYLAEQFPAFCQAAKEAEQLANTSPKASAVLSRSAMELAVIWMFENEQSLRLHFISICEDGKSQTANFRLFVTKPILRMCEKFTFQTAAAAAKYVV